MEAASFFDRALQAARHLPWVAGSDVAEVAEALGDVSELDGRYDTASDAYRRARALRTETLDRVRLMRKEGLVHERAGRYQAALGRWTRAAKLLEGLPEGPEVAAERAVLQLEVAGVRHRQGRYEQQVAAAHAAAGYAEAARDRAALARAYYLLESGYAPLDRNEAAKYHEAPLRIYTELGDEIGRANVLNNLGVTAQEEGRWEEADRLLAESSRAFERAGDVVGAATSSLNRGELFLLQNRYEESRRMLQQVLRVFRSARYAWGIWSALGMLGHLDVRTGDPEGGLETLREATERCRSIGAAGVECYLAVLTVDGLVRAGRPAEALEAAAALAGRSEAVEDPVLSVQLRRYHARALRSLDRAEDALRSADEAAEVAEETGLPYELGRSLELRAEVLDDLGRTDEATEARARGRELLSALGVAL